MNCRAFGIPWSALILAMAITRLPAEDPVPTFPPPPRLATTASDLDAFKKSPEFEELKKARAKEADALLANPVVIPEKEAQWIFYYACPKDGADLAPSKPPAEHQCPVCKQVYTDERTVAAYRCKLNYAADNAAQTLGEAYAWTGDERYAAEVKRILLKLAEYYPKYPMRHDRWGHPSIFAVLGGRRYAQSLDEAVGVISMAKAYDLTRTAPTWSEDEKKLVEKDLFGIVKDTLLLFNQGINNHQTWYNAGLMAIASVLADKDLVQKVLTMKGGFRDQLKRSITADGFWYEGTISYHYYALQAMVEIANAGRRMGLPLQDEPGLRSMFEAPLKMSYPNGQFPALNDGDPTSIQGYAAGFEWAWKMYGDPIFAQAAAGGDPARLKKLLGKEVSPDETAVAVKSVNLEGGGLMGLRQGQGAKAVCAFVDYGPHGEGHGHPDKLNMTLYALGREWILDPGRLTYSVPEYKTWCRQTVAHNTVVVDGNSQEPTTGKFLWMRHEANYAAGAVEGGGAYPGVTLRRYLLLNEKMLVDVYEVESEKKHRLDWIVHAISDSVQPVDSKLTGENVPSESGNGYEHLAENRRWTVTGASAWDFKAADGKFLRLWLACHAAAPAEGEERRLVASSPETLLTAKGIGYALTTRVPCLLRRRNESRTRFVCAFDLTGDGSYIRAVRTEGEKPSVEVETADGNWSMAFAIESAATKITPPKQGSAGNGISLTRGPIDATGRRVFCWFRPPLFAGR
jgi:hypothetical protein